jgi:peptidoglycan/xylan/chitin deacetylase (PgdA/CDA1 family)
VSSARRSLPVLALTSLGLWNVWAPAHARIPGVPGVTVKEVAVTFDDLPAVSVVKGDPAALAAFTDRLVESFVSHAVPVTGFVNEGKLTLAGEGLLELSSRIGLLEKWLAAGAELGNHTFSHRSLNELPIEEFQADVVRGELATSALLGRRGLKLRYFRHPFLQVGLDLQKRRTFESWLVERGYTIAPVTIDNDEYMFASVYASFLRAGDAARAAETAEAYLAYMETVFDFQEKLSDSLFGRPIRHVLLLHANSLNADHAGRLFAGLKKRGYSFVPLARALEDPVYLSKDEYVGRWGVSWMHHWEITMGRPRSGSPDPPRWVIAAYEKGRR